MEALYIILMLVLMEGLLSVDNALVLSIATGKLKDPEQRKKALKYGMIGAFAFRALFIFLGVWLVKLWFLKLAGGIYLAYLVYGHFKGEEDQDADGTADKYQRTWIHKLFQVIFRRPLTPFIAVVISVELMDLAFSVDSILAALALSNKFWVLLVGGCLGIVMMRGIAQLFQKMVEKFPLMNHTAFVLIGIIAVKMVLGTVHNIAALFGKTIHEIHIGNGYFAIIVAVVFFGTFVVQKFVKTPDSTQSV